MKISIIVAVTLLIFIIQVNCGGKFAELWGCYDTKNQSNQGRVSSLEQCGYKCNSKFFFMIKKNNGTFCYCGNMSGAKQKSRKCTSSCFGQQCGKQRSFGSDYYSVFRWQDCRSECAACSQQAYQCTSCAKSDPNRPLPYCKCKSGTSENSKGKCCPSNCDSCDENGCLECNEGFYVKDGVCTKINYDEQKLAEGCPIIFSGCNFKGESRSICAGEPDIGEWQVRSVRIPAHMKLTLYIGTEYQGQWVSYTGDQECIHSHELNDAKFLMQHKIEVSEGAAETSFKTYNSMKVEQVPEKHQMKQKAHLKRNN